jgi:hypothetical protein
MFGKIKQMLGIGGVKVRCAPDSPNLLNNGGTLTGKVELTSKSNQLVTSLLVKVVETRTTGKGEEKKTKHFDLGSAVVGTNVDVKPDAPVTLDFSVPYTIAKSMDDKLRDKGGVLGAVGMLGKLAEHEKTTFEVVAHASVKGTALASKHHLPMNLSR